MNLSEIPDDALEKEVERRELQARPKPISDPDFTKLINACVEFIDDLAAKRSDTEHWIFEAAMVAVFGEEVWEWINSKE